MITEKEILTSWVDSYTEDLYSWAMHKIMDKESAQDLVQDTFLAAAEKISTFRKDSSPKTWLFSILNHKIIDIYRKKAGKPVLVEDNVLNDFFDEEGGWKSAKRPNNWEDKDENLLDDDEFRSVLEDCMESLPDHWKASMKFKYLMNKNSNEICQELEISPTNFWQIVHRAKLQLRNCIEENWFRK